MKKVMMIVMVLGAFAFGNANAAGVEDACVANCGAGTAAAVVTGALVVGAVYLSVVDSLKPDPCFDLELVETKVKGANYNVDRTERDLGNCI